MPVATMSGLYLREVRILVDIQTLEIERDSTASERIEACRDEFAVAMVDGVQQPNELEIY